MIQLSEFFQYSFVLIRKRKCPIGASRDRCGESGTAQLLSIHDRAVGVTNLGVTLLWSGVLSRQTGRFIGVLEFISRYFYVITSWCGKAFHITFCLFRRANFQVTYEVSFIYNYVASHYIYGGNLVFCGLIMSKTASANDTRRVTSSLYSLHINQSMQDLHAQFRPVCRA